MRKHYALAKTGLGHCPDARKSVKKRGVAHHTGTDRSVVVDIFDAKTLRLRLRFCLQFGSDQDTSSGAVAVAACCLALVCVANVCVRGLAVHH